jgi:hypothetical protein
MLLACSNCWKRNSHGEKHLGLRAIANFTYAQLRLRAIWQCRHLHRSGQGWLNALLATVAIIRTSCNGSSASKQGSNQRVRIVDLGRN